MQKFIRIGVDLAKNYFQVHALVSEAVGEGGSAVTRKLTRSKMREFLRKSSLAASAWKPAAQHIIGPASSKRWGTRHF